MPDSYENAIEKVDNLLSDHSDVKRLHQCEIEAYKRNFTTGWVIPYETISYNLRLLIDENFPYSAPRVAISPYPDILSWPHLEENGILCVWGEIVTHDYQKIESVIRRLLKDAIELIKKSQLEENFIDFESEIISYWNRYSSSTSKTVSLCRPFDGSRKVIVNYLKNKNHIFADNKVDLDNWKRNRYNTKEQISVLNSILIWPKIVWRPNEYPKSIAELFKLLDLDNENLNLVRDILIENKDRESQSILIGFKTQSGNAIVGAQLSKPKSSKSNYNPLAHGFKNLSSVPKDVLLKRYSAGQFNGISVSRQDYFWIHGRDENIKEMIDLRIKSVVVFGAGSIGSSVITLLARSGVGKITLVDAERLMPENTSRHELGSSKINIKKVTALTKKLTEGFPHLDITEHTCNWQEFHQNNKSELMNFDLIIACIGEWVDDIMLDDERLKNQSFPPVIFGWTEAFACVGHAILLQDDKVSLKSICTPCGAAKLPIATWENIDTIRQEPACGGQFMPYGAVELAHTHAIISELALEVLRGEIENSTHRVWLGSNKLLERTGGKWNPKWFDFHSITPEGGKTVDVCLEKI